MSFTPSLNSIRKVREFMFADIEKSLRLAEDPKIGAPNYLLALGLCCYTEYWGKFVNAKGSNKTSFEAFFRRLGGGYEKLLDHNVKVWKDIRCGLAHSYMIEETAKIVIYGAGDCGIHYDPKSQYQYTFYVKRYFEDFKQAVNDYIYRLESGLEDVRHFETVLKNKPELT